MGYLLVAQNYFLLIHKEFHITKFYYEKEEKNNL